ncbi:BatA domain-containing protein [Planctomicrobium sp. SH668]|uniref:BatA domain-containing protein n=1 Tax=Planctomicrobium sp. SH668 TaxID=3448126 RepID=UPI003F5AE0AE
MSFLQPWMLAFLPVIALPVIIHLINQRRYRTIEWAAMMFLLAANRMSKGYARIRQWLILAARTLAIAGLIFAISRPLTSGWLGLAANGRPDTTIILMDRSPSMSQQGPSGGLSKLVSGRDQLISSLGLIGSQRWVVINGNSAAPVEIETLDALNNLVTPEGVSATSDLPGMLQSALKYIQDNRTGRTEIWICSDVSELDWNAESGRWQSLRDLFSKLPQQVRFHLLAYPEVAPANFSIQVTAANRVQSSTKAELHLSIRVTRSTATETPVSVPVQIEIDGARSTVNLDFSGTEVDLKDHVIPLETSQTRGWGQVSLQADSNPADNQYYFVFDTPIPRKTLIVADSDEAARVLKLSSSISPESAVGMSAETVTRENFGSVDWEPVALILWQGPLPTGTDAELLSAFLKRGGVAVFFPPEVPDNSSFAGLTWGTWQTPPEPISVASWVGDQDLLNKTKNGQGLPLGQLQIRRHCQIEGVQIPLAKLMNGDPLLLRAETELRNVYFCSTTPDRSNSNLVQNGIVLYVMIQRALEKGAASLGATRQYIAGEVPAGSTADWSRLAGEKDSISTEFPLQAGVYKDGERFLAVNRSSLEDRPKSLNDAQIAGLFEGLEFSRVDQVAGKSSPLLSEIWRLFLILMAVALITESLLCLPRVAPKTQTQSPFAGDKRVTEAVSA